MESPGANPNSFRIIRVVVMICWRAVDKELCNRTTSALNRVYSRCPKEERLLLI